MRLSHDTLLLLAREGDADAEHIILWIHGMQKPWKQDFRPWWEMQRKDAEAWTSEGRLGAGYPGCRFIQGSRINVSRREAA